MNISLTCTRLWITSLRPNNSNESTSTNRFLEMVFWNKTYDITNEGLSIQWLTCLSFAIPLRSHSFISCSQCQLKSTPRGQWLYLSTEPYEAEPKSVWVGLEVMINPMVPAPEYLARTHAYQWQKAHIRLSIMKYGPLCRKYHIKVPRIAVLTQAVITITFLRELQKTNYHSSPK